MTQTRHIIILVLMLTVLGLSANAQSTPRSPYEGALHTYTVNGITVGAGFEFNIAANADGSGIYDDDLTGEFDIINKTGIVGDDGLASTPIQWNVGASAHVYYLFMEATAPEPGGCSNHIYLRITPQVNQFDLLSENVPVSNTVSCPATASTDGFNPVAGAYDAGSTVLQFKVRREKGTIAMAGDTCNWSFIPLLEVAPDIAGNLNVIIEVKGIDSDDIYSDVANRYTIDGSDEEVLVTVTIQNEPGTDLEATLRITSVQEHNTNLSDSDPSNDNVTHTIQVMPVIDGMGGV